MTIGADLALGGRLRSALSAEYSRLGFHLGPANVPAADFPVGGNPALTQSNYPIVRTAKVRPAQGVRHDRTGNKVSWHTIGCDPNRRACADRTDVHRGRCGSGDQWQTRSDRLLAFGSGSDLPAAETPFEPLSRPDGKLLRRVSLARPSISKGGKSLNISVPDVVSVCRAQKAIVCALSFRTFNWPASAHSC